MRDVTINESSESGGPCISIPLKQRGTKDAAPPLGDIAEPFYFDSRGLVGVTLLISNGIPAPSFFFFFLSFSSRHRGFPPPENSRLSRFGRDKDTNGLFIIPRKCDARNCPEFCSLRPPRTGGGGGGNVSPFAVADFGKRFGVEIVETRAQFQTDS